MLIKIFTIEFNAQSKSFDDAEIVAFLKDKVLLSVKDYLIEEGGKKFLAVVITFSVKEQRELIGAKNVGQSKDWEKLINVDNQPLFEALKNWRRDESKRQGLPPFIIFTNKQLADITVMGPKTLNHLSQVDGVGPQKLNRYGDLILSLVERYNEELSAKLS